MSRCRGASPGRGRRQKLPASSSLRGGGQRRADSRCRVRRSECDRGRVYLRPRRPRLRRAGRRRELRGSAERRDGGRVEDNFFHGGEDDGAERAWRVPSACPAGLPSVSATLRPPPGPQGRQCLPLRARLSGFARTLFAFARNATEFIWIMSKLFRNVPLRTQVIMSPGFVVFFFAPCLAVGDAGRPERSAGRPESPTARHAPRCCRCRFLTLPIRCRRHG